MNKEESLETRNMNKEEELGGEEIMEVLGHGMGLVKTHLDVRYSEGRNGRRRERKLEKMKLQHGCVSILRGFIL